MKLTEKMRIEIQNKIRDILPEYAGICRYQKCEYKPCPHAKGATCIIIRIKSEGE